MERKKILMYSQLKIINCNVKLKIMQKLMQSRLFRLLLETSQHESYISQLEESCDEFALMVLNRLQLEKNHQELYFSLGFVHSKLVGTCNQLSGEQGKKCLENRNQSHLFGQVGYASIGVANHSTKQQSQECI